MSKPLKYPVSALVILHDTDGNILLIERSSPAGFWQSVTGSKEAGETIAETARREVLEETGISLPENSLSDWHDSTVYEIYHHWRHRYPEGVFENREHLFSAEINRDTPINLSPEEHVRHAWLPFTEAAEKVFSPSNKRAILELAKRRGWLTES
ncbi:dihydroneopterin triphosphate diphosphatase [Neisseria animalis]|uniref:Dihydroneopterin triphosphate diphosphatase n=1 Tax=Neisseria animalis TaxID=492 RepID=A0A5P3MUE2_NEIAN|nr:dihydroneopterin triphosphate diphosphatase [Neisseria animalis]QEY24381.1 dihydroneopterin triphosphate diphosphatase [Neisseria animalis]ROW31449.1 dihydroneopterin triphosphate diphosphatase [Neisseria animalis]VEE06918.1 dATP pyrophosphohydrolase [Neisseria animalis]